MKKVQNAIVLTSLLCLSIPTFSAKQNETRKTAITTTEENPQTTPNPSIKTVKDTPPPAPARKMEKLNLKETKEAYHYYSYYDKKPQIKQALERLISLSTDHEEIGHYLLALAELNFEMQHFAEAELLYNRYALLFPGNSNIAYIKERELESSCKQMLDPMRDQSKTKKTITCAQECLELITDTTKTEKIKTILDDCYRSLLQSELEKIYFYTARYAYTERQGALGSIRKRLLYCAEEILPHMKKPDAKKLAKEMVDALKKTDKKTVKTEELQPWIDKAAQIFLEPAPKKTMLTLF